MRHVPTLRILYPDGLVVEPPRLSLDHLLGNLPGAVYRRHNDSGWTMEFVSDGIEALTGYSSGAYTILPRLSFASLIYPEDRDRVVQTINEAIKTNSSFQLTYRIRRRDGAVRWLWGQGVLVPSSKGGDDLLEGFITDITRMREAEILVQEQASFLRYARDAIVALEMDSRITFWNKGAERLYGWTYEEVRGERFCDLVCEHLPCYMQAYQGVLESGEWYGELKHLRQDGTAMIAEASWTLLPRNIELGVPQKILIISADITERKRCEDQIKQLAFSDPLTELPNRTSFMNHLNRVLVESARTKLYGALLFCDLDNFKRINDTDGHAIGDSLLQAVAQRLKRCVREADVIARLGDDEFVVIIEPTEHTGSNAAIQAQTMAEKLIKTMVSPVHCADTTYTVSISIGITTLCGLEDTMASALQAADLAMYEAKASGRNTFRFHNPGVQAAWRARATLDRDLRRALHEQEFVLYYQPQLDDNDCVIGAEALLRWRLPNGRIVFPDEFIKVAEESQLIVELGTWVLRTGCEQLALWQKQSMTAHLTLSINVSARQFIASDFVATLQHILEETGVNPRRLKLELTESLLVHDFEATARTMTILKGHGVSFSLDDFGTGYSSLAYLRKLPLDQLKIDRMFMCEALTNKDDASIVRSIIALAANLGLQVIAEGVETLGQRAFLWEAGCRHYQGYLYNEPINADHFMRYVQIHKPTV